MALAPTPPSCGWWWGRPWETMIQTSKTKSETTSFLKLPKEDLLGTNTALLGLWVMWGGLVAMVPQPPSTQTVRAPLWAAS